MRKLPIPPDEFMRQAFNTIELMDRQSVKIGSDQVFSNNKLIITSPNGTMFQIVVSDLGVVSAVAL